MALKQPQSMDECVYFTRRKIGDGNAVAWVFRGKCPKCKKGIMGKPRDPKTGAVKIRSTKYECPECGHAVEKKAYEETLEVNIEYVCPACKHEGETHVPYKRKKYQGVDAVVFECGQCSAKIPITKKMKEKGEKD